MMKENGRVGVVLEIRSIEFRAGICHFRNVKSEQEQMSDIDLPSAAQNLCGPYQETLLPHFAAVHQRCRVARYENKDFGCVTETVVADGDLAGNIAHLMRGNVVEEDHPE
jgi:hypothetical protein